MAGEELTRATVAEIKARLARRGPQAAAEAQKRYDETTEADIRRHAREEGYEPDAEIPPDAWLAVPVKLVREKLGMTQAELAALLHVPLGTLRNWEENRFGIDPGCRPCCSFSIASPRPRCAPCATPRDDPGCRVCRPDVWQRLSARGPE